MGWCRREVSTVLKWRNICELAIMLHLLTKFSIFICLRDEINRQINHSRVLENSFCDSHWLFTFCPSWKFLRSVDRAFQVHFTCLILMRSVEYFFSWRRRSFLDNVLMIHLFSDYRAVPKLATYRRWSLKWWRLQISMSSGWDTWVLVKKP